jgi:hypothetical protein
MTDDAFPIQERAPWIDGALALVVHKSLRREPKRRWRNIRELANALRPFAGGDERLEASQLRPASSKTRSKVARRVDLKAPFKEPSLSAKLVAATKARERSVHGGGVVAAFKTVLIAGFVVAGILGVVVLSTGKDFESAKLAALKAWEWLSVR